MISKREAVTTVTHTIPISGATFLFAKTMDENFDLKKLAICVVVIFLSGLHWLLVECRHSKKQNGLYELEKMVKQNKKLSR